MTAPDPRSESAGGPAQVEAARARVRWGWTTAVLLVVCLGLVALLTLWLGWLPLAILGGALVVAVTRYLAGHSSELRAMGAIAADPIRHAGLIKEVEVLAHVAGVAPPAVYVSDQPIANAFAVRTAAGAAVCVTRELMDTLEPEELRAVLAHELGHVKNRDSTFSLAFEAITSSIRWTFLVVGVISAVMFAFLTRGRGAQSLTYLLTALTSWVGGVVAKILFMASVRQREYTADLESATLTGDPLALARALRRIDGSAHGAGLDAEFATASVVNLCIVSPLASGTVASWMASHPSTDNRVLRLENLVAPEVRQQVAARLAVVDWQRERERLAEELERVTHLTPSAPVDMLPFALRRDELVWGAFEGRLVSPRTRQGVVSFALDSEGWIFITTDRLVHAGPDKRTEWRWDKAWPLTWCTSDSGPPWLKISVTNRQKASGVRVPQRSTGEVRALIDLALADWSGERDRLGATAAARLARHDQQHP